MGFGVEVRPAGTMAAPGGLRWLLVETDRQKRGEKDVDAFSQRVFRTDSDRSISWSRYNMGFWDFCWGCEAVSLAFPSLPLLSSRCPWLPIENMKRGIDAISLETRACCSVS